MKKRLQSLPQAPEIAYQDQWGMEFVSVSASTFLMGREIVPQDYFTQEVAHTVTLTQSFLIQTTPVTQAQWLAVMGDNPSKFQDHPDLPVETVTWSDAKRLIGQLNQSSQAVIYRLPTEAEWELSCRAGSATKYYFGDDDSLLEDYAWTENNAQKRPHPVKQKLPNAWGLYDCYGNVWEWVEDKYEVYPLYALTDPTGPEKGAKRVVRGGCVLTGPSRCNSAARGMCSPSKTNSHHGFRLAISLK
jgi:formylglycine-generating enzyme required for sulfatase activity